MDPIHYIALLGNDRSFECVQVDLSVDYGFICAFMASLVA